MWCEGGSTPACIPGEEGHTSSVIGPTLQCVDLDWCLAVSIRTPAGNRQHIKLGILRRD